LPFGTNVLLEFEYLLLFEININCRNVGTMLITCKAVKAKGIKIKFKITYMQILIYYLKSRIKKQSNSLS